MLVEVSSEAALVELAVAEAAAVAGIGADDG